MDPDRTQIPPKSLSAHHGTKYATADDGEPDDTMEPRRPTKPTLRETPRIKGDGEINAPDRRRRRREQATQPHQRRPHHHTHLHRGGNPNGLSERRNGRNQIRNARTIGRGTRDGRRLYSGSANGRENERINALLNTSSRNNASGSEG